MSFCSEWFYGARRLRSCWFALFSHLFHLNFFFYFGSSCSCCCADALVADRVCVCFLPSEFSHFFLELGHTQRAHNSLCVCVFHFVSARETEQCLSLWVSRVGCGLLLFFFAVVISVFSCFSFGKTIFWAEIFRQNVFVCSTFAGAAYNQLDLAAKFFSISESIQRRCINFISFLHCTTFTSFSTPPVKLNRQTHANKQKTTFHFLPASKLPFWLLLQLNGLIKSWILSAINDAI